MFVSTQIKPLDESELPEQVDRLQAEAGRDLPFLTTLVETLTRLLEGEFGAVMVTPGKKPPRLVAVYPIPTDGRLALEPEKTNLLRDCAMRCRESGQLNVFRVGTGQRVLGAVCAPLVRRSKVEGVAIVLTASAGQSMVDQRQSQIRWITGLYSGHVASRMLGRQVRQAGETRAALAVLSAAQQAGHFEACCMSVCNQIKIEMQAERVSLGWAHRGSVQLLAMSDTENIDRRQELIGQIEAAMEECFDQEQAIIAPSDHLRDAEAWLTEAVARCHHELIGQDSRTSTCSVPLRTGDDVVGVVTVERTAKQRFSGVACSHLQAIGDLVTPRLVDRHEIDRPIVVKIWQSMRYVLGRLLGSDHVGWKISVLVMFGLLLYTCLGTWPYRIKSSFVLEAGAKHVHSASFSGFLLEAHVEPGDRVEENNVLAQLDDTELRLALAGVRGELEAQRAASLVALGDVRLQGAEVKRANAMIDKLEAHAALLNFQIERATLLASEPGVVLSGEWRERIGVRVELGEPIFEVAPIRQLRAVILVDEADIDRISVGDRGELATRSNPDQMFAFTIRRIMPVGEPHKGRNVFAVRAAIAEHSDWMLPGMQGTAKIDSGKAPIIWIATHRLIDFLRLKLWW